MDSTGGFRVEVLGPVEAWVGDRRVALGGQRPRALVAMLALTPGGVVSSDRLIDELWGEDPPARARESLQMHVSRLRKALGEAGNDNRLVGRAGGYVLELGRGARDVDRWESALGRARQARATGRLEAARMAIEEALGVWRGAPFAGASAHGLLDGERARLEEERLAATIEGIEIDLELGRHGELLGQLEALTVAHPFKERVVALQMLALYRSGRQADALAAFHAARSRFVEELGIEPGRALRELHEDVLCHAETLGVEPRLAPLVARGGRGLPVPPNRTIGREHDLEAIGERLRVGSVRLLTLTGTGGVGKTRLAVEVARRVAMDFADGGCFVSLAALQRPEDVPAAIVTTLGVTVASGESPGAAIERFLADKHLLLVVDNFEHVLAAAPFIGGLLENCAALTVLATSREPLALYAEERYPVSPLALPELGTLGDPERLAGVGAVALFCERAHTADPDFDLPDANPAVVAEICRRLDGLPLAIELAAARCGVLSAGEIAERLASALGALGVGPRDAPARQQTLPATIDWSYNLLGEAEKECFARFAVFAGGATIEAAETVTRAGLDALEQLVAKSLLVRRQQANAPTRLRMLETIREYATGKLRASGEAQAAQTRHANHMLAVAERAEPDLLAGRKAAFDLLELEHDNIRAALDWAHATARHDLELRLAGAVWFFWYVHGHASEALARLDAALVAAGPVVGAARAKALRGRGLIRIQLRRLEEAEADGRELLALAAHATDPDLRAMALVVLGGVAHARGEYDRARTFHQELAVLSRQTGDDALLAVALGSGLADIALNESRFQDAAALSTEAFDIALTAGDVPGLVTPLGNLASALLGLGRADEATERFAESLRHAQEIGDPLSIAWALAGLGAAAAALGRPQPAARLLGAADAALTTSRSGLHPFEARRHTQAIDQLRNELGDEAFTAAWLQGQTMTPDDATALGLDEASRSARPA